MMRGVSWNNLNKRWRVAIGRSYLGEYADKALAVAVRRSAEMDAFGSIVTPAQPIVREHDVAIPLCCRDGFVQAWARVDRADWKEPLSSRNWCLSASKYVVARDGRKILRLHREIMQPKRSQVVDHINGDALDNRRGNLRICGQGDNARNAGLTKGRSVKGVQFRRGGFVAVIQHGDKKKMSRTLPTEADAAREYDRMAIAEFGEFARTNEQLGYFDRQQPVEVSP